MIEKKLISNGNRQSSIAIFLTILICIVVLVFSSSISVFLFQFQTGERSVSLEKLVLHFGKNGFFLLQLLPFFFTTISLLLCVKFIHKEKPFKLLTSRNKFDFNRFFLSFSVWIMITCIFFCINFIFFPDQIKWNFNSSFWNLLLISIIFVTIQTAFEEVLFRGYLLKHFILGTKSILISVFLSSLLFAMMHINNPEIEKIGYQVLIYFFGTGFFLALISILDKGLELAIGFHAANNLFASVILTNNWQVFQTDALWKDFSKPSTGIEVWINLVLIFPLLIFIYGKFFKWNYGIIIANFTKNKKQ